MLNTSSKKVHDIGISSTLSSSVLILLRNEILQLIMNVNRHNFYYAKSAISVIASPMNNAYLYIFVSNGCTALDIQMFCYWKLKDHRLKSLTLHVHVITDVY